MVVYDVDVAKDGGSSLLVEPLMKTSWRRGWLGAGQRERDSNNLPGVVCRPVSDGWFLRRWMQSFGVYKY
ncbi:hypothetical protein E1B28_007084 [Marasmius oreades]|uniref:Uncharacterized protein n=1 Tax=Marasmius oreades TaxID=181124 RepID=A0A9P7S139_9AGAR|nr:uncharacterized protein E1B28_007084 [Marasmius oreades]KAG7093402.1 hypothetical protein E1B28_007084 [Marasmius oreades]